MKARNHQLLRRDFLKGAARTAMLLGFGAGHGFCAPRPVRPLLRRACESRITATARFM
jgi:hypothetical protein